MKLLWLGHFVPYPPRGGAPQRSFNLICELGRQSELHFFGLSHRAHQSTPQDVWKAEEALSRSCASVRVERIGFLSSRAGKGFGVVRALTTRRSYNESWLGSGRLRRLAAERIAAVAPDLVHVDSEMIAGWVPARCAPAAVLNHHNVESHMLERRAAHTRRPARWLFSLEARRLRAFERAQARRFRRHLVVSDLDAERLRAIVGDVPCDIVPNGVDVDYFAPDPARVAGADGSPSLVFAGRMNWYPNEHGIEQFLLRVWPEIKQRIPGVRLVVAGMNPTRSLRARARSDPSVTVTGRVDDIRPVIAAATAYVCPILDGGGTRLKLLDAMALGQAIVATPLAAEGLQVEDGRHLLIREFGAAFAQGVCQVLLDRELRESLSTSARERAVSRYSWRSIADGLLGAYRDAIRSSSP